MGQSQIPADINLWIPDLEFVKQKSEKEIPNFNTHSNKNEYLNAINALSSLSNLPNSDSLVFELQKAFNLIGDDGSNIIPFQTALSLDLVPVKAYWFNDGLFIIDAKNKAIIGEEIVTINGTTTSALFKKLQPYISADNINYQKKRFPIYAFMPRLLKHIGTGESDTKIDFSFSSGKQTTIAAETPLEYVKLQKISDKTDDIFKVSENLLSRNYWKTLIPNSSTLFIQLKKIEDEENAISFKSFVSEIENDLTNNNVNQVILDLRHGGTGNGFKMNPLVNLLKESSKINRRGSLFILLSGSTKGPLVELASILEQNTKAVLIGEPSGEGPNSVSDTRYLILKNTGLGISLTEKYWPTTWQFDQRESIKPEITIQYNFKDYYTNKDPWIETALSFSNQENLQSIPENISYQLIGKYEIDSEDLFIQKKGKKVYLVKKKKMGNFFELKTELYFEKEGKLKSDIVDVYLEYKLDSNQKAKTLKLYWKGTIIKLIG